MLIGLFLAGVGGIQILSRIMHRLLPSHVVDCDHTHGDEEDLLGERRRQQEEMSEHCPDDEHTNGLPVAKFHSEQSAHDDDEDTPLLARTTSMSPPKPRQPSAQDALQNKPSVGNGFAPEPTSRQPSLVSTNFTRTLTKYMAGRKENCDESGPCMGFSDPCGQDCFKVVQRRGSALPGNPAVFSPAPTWRNFFHPPRFSPAVGDGDDHVSPHGTLNHEQDGSGSVAPDAHLASPIARPRHTTHHYHHLENGHWEASKPLGGTSAQSHSMGKEHHHHVPTNAFMSIGLQTSLAIALHKAPEGFITYATNHANPTLGFAVFMALFIHNITEGFAMSLPLYLALGSRLKAMAWSSFLGGVSQPIGAGIAALWFKLAKRSSLGAPTEAVYGGMFAVTSGVMTSVALSLFSESLQLSHNKGTCISFAFLGMGILGLSFALTAK